MSGYKEAMKERYDRILEIYDSDKYESYREQEKVIEKVFSDRSVFEKANEEKAKEEILQAVLLRVVVLDSFYSTNLGKSPSGVYKMANYITNLEMKNQIHDKICKAHKEGGQQEIIGSIAKCKLEKTIKDKNKVVTINPYSFATKYCFHHNQNAFRIYDSFVREVLVLCKLEKTIKDKNKVVTINPYSFATKYCFHHNQNAFRIYDSFVREVLVFFNNGKSDTSNKFADIPSELVGTNFFGEKLIDTKLRKIDSYDTFLKAIDKFAKHYGLANENTQHRRDLDHFLWILGKEQKNDKTQTHNLVT